MTQSSQQVPLPHVDYVSLQFCWFAFWWLVIVCIYFTTSVYSAAYAKFYWIFGDIYLRYSHDVGMPQENFRTIAYVHVVMATMHGICALSMIIGSLRQRTLAFSFSPTTIITKTIDKTMTNSKPTSIIQSLHTIATAAYRKTIHRRGVFGVNGKYFNTFLLCRKIVEMGLQTVQAFRMSKFLPRTLLNRFYVCLVAANCWSSALNNSNWFWKTEAHRRFAAIVGDCALSLMSTVGVAILVVSSYVNEYDPALTGFRYELLQDDEWVSQMINEAQVVVVVSWADLASRFIFSIGILTSTTNMKELLHCIPRTSNRVAHGGPEATSLTSLSSAPNYFYPTKPKTAAFPTQRNKLWANKTLHKVLLYGVHFLLAVWGIAILMLHIHASSKPPLATCMPRVQPFAGILPSCLVLNFNCHELDITGEKKVVKAEWEKFESGTVMKLQFVHCPALEVPESFQTFRRLAEIKMYNTTILEWGADAAITNTHHPGVSIMSVVRVHMKAGLLPLGFQSLDFPLNLKQLFFCETNLQKVPDNLDTKWPVGSTVSIENSMLTDVPPALARLRPQSLVLSGNPLQNFSTDLFETESMQFVLISRNNVTQLPENVTQPVAGPLIIDITNTKISFFWSWIDQLIENSIEKNYPPPIYAGGSTYCLERDDIMNGLTDNFNKPFVAGQSPLLMNASMTNWDVLLAAVDCTPVLLLPNFPLAAWDQIYAITNEQERPNG